MLLIFIQVLVHAVIWPNNLITGFLCYDDGCHLKKYANNPVRASQTPTAIRLASLNIVIDKMYFKGHIDQWCHQNCNPHSFRELDSVSWLQTGHLPNILSLMSFKCSVLSLLLDIGESEQSLCMSSYVLAFHLHCFFFFPAYKSSGTTHIVHKFQSVQIRKRHFCFLWHQW